MNDALKPLDTVLISHPSLKGTELKGIVEVVGDKGTNASTRCFLPSFNQKGVWFKNSQLTKIADAPVVKEKEKK